MNITDYDEAKKIFLNYNGSYFHMHREEVLSEYKKYKIPEYYEKKWLYEKSTELLLQIKIETNNKIRLEKYIRLLELIFKLKNEEINKKILYQIKKDFLKMDLFSKVIIAEIIFNEIKKKKLEKNYKIKRITKELLEKSLNNIIISKDFMDKNGIYFYNLTEEEIIERYRNILKNLD